VQRGLPADEAWDDARAALAEVVPFSEEQARIAGELVLLGRPLGLSLGDRACLALALTLKAPLYTADRAWKSLKLGIRVHVSR
jgi:ribonuclease VapC